MRSVARENQKRRQQRRSRRIVKGERSVGCGTPSVDTARFIFNLFFFFLTVQSCLYKQAQIQPPSPTTLPTQVAIFFFRVFFRSLGKIAAATRYVGDESVGESIDVGGGYSRGRAGCRRRNHHRIAAAVVIVDPTTITIIIALHARAATHESRAFVRAMEGGSRVVVSGVLTVYAHTEEKKKKRFCLYKQ